MSPFLSQHRRNGYSLIEVTLAIGVIAVGVVAVMGLIPQGLRLMGTADETATEARISQRIVGELMLAEWDNVDGYHGERRYFDREGIALWSEVRGGLPKDETNLAYVAQIEVLPPEGSIPAADAPPGEDGALDANLNLKRVQVHIADVPLVDFKFTDPKQYHTFATVVARMDQ